jgi:hypothetical protein
LGEVRNITTEKDIYLKTKIVKADVIDEEKPLYHDNKKLVSELAKIIGV